MRDRWREALRKDYTFIPQPAAYRLLEIFDIPHPPWRFVKDASEAVDAAENLGYPVVLKIDSPDIYHKSDVGGVRVDLKTGQAVHDAFKDISRETKLISLKTIYLAEKIFLKLI